MIQIKPFIPTKCTCSCGGNFYFSEVLWQGLHICEKLICSSCGRSKINSLPVNQSTLELYTYYPDSGLINDTLGNIVADNWYSTKLKSITKPVLQEIEIEIDIVR